MKISIKATNFNLTPSIETWVLGRIGSLEKFISKLDAKGVVSCRVEVGKTTHHHYSGPVFRAEANLSLPGKLLRAEAVEKDLKLAITKAKDELQIQIQNYKGSQDAKFKRGARVGKKMLNYDEAAMGRGEVDLSTRHREE